MVVLQRELHFASLGREVVGLSHRKHVHGPKRTQNFRKPAFLRSADEQHFAPIQLLHFSSPAHFHAPVIQSFTRHGPVQRLPERIVAEHAHFNRRPRTLGAPRRPFHKSRKIKKKSSLHLVLTRRLISATSRKCAGCRRGP